MLRWIHIGVIAVVFVTAASVCAQDDDVSLGDLARSLRKPTPANEQVIDNDNLPIVMDQAESKALGGKPVFSIDPSGKSFRMTSPDGSCSLSFDARVTPLISTQYVATNLPQDELLKLGGEAAIHDGVIQVSLYNGTNWDVKEIVVSVTVLQDQNAFGLRPATLTLPAEAGPAQKLPDVTLLYHLKAAGPPDSTTVFQGDLGDDLGQARDWHWALVGARGVPPAAPGSIAPTAASQPLPVAPVLPASPLPSLTSSPTADSGAAVPVHKPFGPSPVTAIQPTVTPDPKTPKPLAISGSPTK